jgi:hypothetical protein
MFLHEAWVDITKEKPPNIGLYSWTPRDSEYQEILILTKEGEIVLASPEYRDDEDDAIIDSSNNNGQLELWLKGGFYQDVEKVTHWMLLDNLYKKGEA